MKEKRFDKAFAGRVLLLLAGLFCSGLGVAATRRGELGVSPVSSVPNVVALRFPALTFGTWLFLWNCLLVAGEVLILRRRFKPWQLLQIPLSVLFGWFTDLGGRAAALIPNGAYPLRILCVVAGTLILGFGIALTVRADLVMNAGEAFVKAVADECGRPFGTVKTLFDVSSVLLSVVLSLLLFSFRVEGTREGTVIAALGTGYAVRLWQKLVGPAKRAEPKA